MTISILGFAVSIWQYEPTLKNTTSNVAAKTTRPASASVPAPVPAAAPLLPSDQSFDPDKLKAQLRDQTNERVQEETARITDLEEREARRASEPPKTELPEDLRQEQITKELARKMARDRGDPEPGSCRDKLECWGEQNQLHASSACAKIVERMASYSAEWTDGWLGSKFTHYRWADKKAGIVTHIGDSVKFQNGFGAWQNMTYECDFNPQTKAILDVRVSPGRM